MLLPTNKKKYDSSISLHSVLRRLSKNVDYHLQLFAEAGLESHQYSCVNLEACLHEKLLLSLLDEDASVSGGLILSNVEAPFPRTLSRQPMLWDIQTSSFFLGYSLDVFSRIK